MRDFFSSIRGLPQLAVSIALFSVANDRVHAQNPPVAASPAPAEEPATGSTLTETEVSGARPAPARSYDPPVQITPPSSNPAPVSASAPTPGPIIGDNVFGPSAPPSGTFLPSSGLGILQVRSPQDIVRYAPNQFATDSGSRSFGDIYTSRGLANTVFFGAPATTIYVDDVPFGETFTYARKIAAINSIEVFRGPQPTLVGRNTYGGLINIQSRRPSDRLEGNLNLGAGSFNLWEADGWLMGPVNDNLGFRIAGSSESSDGFLINTLTGKPVDSQEHWGFSGGLFFSPSPDWEIGFTAGYDQYNDGAPRLTSLDRTTGFYTVTSNTPGEQFRQTNDQAIRIAHEGSNFKVLSVSSHRGFDLDPYTIDLDFGNPFLPPGFVSLAQSQELWSQEFRIADNDPSAEWGWNAGLYGSTSRIQGDGLRGFTIPLPFPPFSADIRQRTVHTIDETALAAYGGLEYRDLDPFTIRIGGRVDWIERSLIRDKSQTPFPPFNQPRIALEDEWLHFTPNVGVDWDFDENFTAYARSSYAFKPGGFSAYADNPAQVPFDQERVWATEAGVRTKGFERLEANFTAFYNSVENYQVERSFTATDYAVFNAAEAEIYGLEAAMRYGLSPTLDFLGTFGWTHARLTEYIDPVSGRSLDGNTPPFVPEFDALVALDYHVDSGFFSRIEFQGVGDVWFDDFNRPDFRQASYGLVNAAIGWRGDNWNAQLFGSNLTQEEYYTIMNTDVRTGAVGMPRIFGVRAGFQF